MVVRSATHNGSDRHRQWRFAPRPRLPTAVRGDPHPLRVLTVDALIWSTSTPPTSRSSASRGRSWSARGSATCSPRTRSVIGADAVAAIAASLRRAAATGEPDKLAVQRHDLFDPGPGDLRHPVLEPEDDPDRSRRRDPAAAASTEDVTAYVRRGGGRQRRLHGHALRRAETHLVHPNPAARAGQPPTPRDARDQLAEQTLRDPLTGLLVRPVLLEATNSALARLRRHAPCRRHAVHRSRPAQVRQRHLRPRGRRRTAPLLRPAATHRRAARRLHRPHRRRRVRRPSRRGQLGGRGGARGRARPEGTVRIVSGLARRRGAGREHRRRRQHLGGHDRGDACSPTPTRRCTGPRPTAADGSRTSTSSPTRRSAGATRPRPTCARRFRTASCGCTTSRFSTWTPAIATRSRRCCAGSTRSGDCWPRASSSTSPRTAR